MRVWEEEEEKDFSRNISSPPSLRRRSEDFNPTEERFSFGASSLLLSLSKGLLRQSLRLLGKIEI